MSSCDSQSQRLSNWFESYVIIGKYLSVMWLCGSTFTFTNFIFQWLLSSGERMSPNTCSKIPRQALSRWMVPATATNTNPWGEETHFNPWPSRFGQNNRRSCPTRAWSRWLTSSAPLNSSKRCSPVHNRSRNLTSSQKCWGPHSCTGSPYVGFWELRRLKNHWQNCFPKAVTSDRPSPMSGEDAVVLFPLTCLKHEPNKSLVLVNLTYSVALGHTCYDTTHKN